MKSENIYEMPLGSYTYLEGLIFYRVPGGWLVRPRSADQAYTFVPFNNEFMPVKEVRDPWERIH